MKKDNMQPLITIGITCYNASDTISRAISGAFAQGWGNIEIIIADDCSSDNSVDIIERLIKDNPNAKLIKHYMNKGVAVTRQNIIDKAKGEFIVFFDDDDESLPERCRVQYERIISEETQGGSELVACYISGKRIYSNGYEFELKAVGSYPNIPQGAEMADYLLFFGKRSGVFYGGGTPTCALMARKSTFDVVGGFDANFRRVEDIDLAVRISLAGGCFVGCREQLLMQYATQAVDKSPEKNLNAEIQLAEKYKDYLVSVGRYEYACRWPLIRYHHFTNHHGRMVWELLKLFIRCPIKVIRQFLYTAPRRLLHEFKMGGRGRGA